MDKVLAIVSSTEKLKEFKHGLEGIYNSKCILLSNNILGEIENFIPQCIVIYINGASRQKLYPIIDLKEDKRFINIPVILIADEDDRNVYKANITNHPEYELPSYTDMETIRKGIDRLIAAFGGKKHILVVDDDMVSLKVTKGYLEPDYKVICVKSGTQALKFLEKQSPDLILLDCYMPEMDGPTTFRKIRMIFKDNNEIPVVFLTGNSEKDMVMRSLSMRPSGFLLKPVNKEELLAKVIELV